MNSPSMTRPIDILIVEDNPTDVMLMREALEHAQLPNNLHVASDGVEGMEFLRRQGQYATAPRPELILLDLNMPRMSGHEVLAAIKADASLRSIPIVILTTSSSKTDVNQAYEQHANCYITKPVDFDAFAEAVRCIRSFWFTIVTLPPSELP